MIIIEYIGIFQGGGIKGIAHIGAIKALEERGFKCVKAAGSSVGAIIASLLVVGYKAKELIQIMFNLNLNSLKEKHSFFSAFKNLGLHSSTPLEQYLDRLFLYKGIKYFQDLKQGSDYLLKIIITDITKRKKVILPNELFKYKIHPDGFKISKAIVMSCTYPFFYNPLKLNKSLIFDGGIADNFPLDVFNNNKIMKIGFNLVSKDHDIIISDDAYIIKIPTLGINTLDFNISIEEKKKLFLSGYTAARKFINEFFLHRDL